MTDSSVLLIIEGMEIVALYWNIISARRLNVKWIFCFLVCTEGESGVVSSVFFFFFTLMESSDTFIHNTDT